MKRAHRISRIAYAALVVVLLVLVGVGIGSTFVTKNAAQSAAAAANRAEIVESARIEIGAEGAFALKYRLDPSPDLRAAHRVAGESIVRELEIAQMTPGESMADLVNAVKVAQRAYVVSAHRMFDAVDAHDLGRASSIDRQETDPAFTDIQTTVYDEANHLNEIADNASVALHRTEDVALAITLFVSFFGIVALYAIFIVLRHYKLQVDGSLADEMDHLRKAALTDYLTGLGNHRAYQEAFDNQAEICRSVGNTLTVAIVDVDELKVLNDRHGHAKGDGLLASLAKVLRASDLDSVPFRLGGDKFALTFTGMSADTARARLEDVRAIVEAELGGTTISIGFASMSGMECDPLLLREQADAALYEAKRRGRNTVVAFDEIRSEAPMFLPARVAEVRALIETGEIGVAFQPIWNVEGRSIVGYEALARPYGDDPINPQDAFDIAEKIGKAHELDRVCRDAVLRKASSLPAGSLLFINVSPQSFDHEIFAGAALLHAVKSAGLTPDRVVLEITERSVARLNVVVREAKRLRALGFALALDDAGSGNSGLEMLSQLDVDYVKVDREVIVRAQSGGGRAVLAGIVAIAHEMGARIIAEGIEDAEMLDLVMMATHASDIPTAVQGYFVGRPAPDFVGAAESAVVKGRLAASRPAAESGTPVR